MSTLETLLQQIEEYKQSPPKNAWKTCFQASFYLLQLESQITVDSTEKLKQTSEQLTKTTWQAADKLKTEWSQAAIEDKGTLVLKTLLKRFESALADQSIDPTVLLSKIDLIQKKLHAVEWILQNFPKNNLLVESIESLSFNRREVRRMLENSSKKLPSYSQELKESLARIQEHVLAEETDSFIDETQELLNADPSKLHKASSILFSQAPQKEEQSLLPQASEKEKKSPLPLASEKEKQSPLPLASEKEVASEPSSQKIEEERKKALQTSPVALKAISLGRALIVPAQQKSGSREMNQCWQELMDGERLRLEIQAEQLKNPESISKSLLDSLNNTDARCQQLRLKITEFLHVMSVFEQRMWLAERLQDFQDQSDEQLATIDDIEIEEALEGIEHLQKRAAWLQTLVTPLCTKENQEDAFSIQAKAFFRIQKRLIIERQERKLQKTLEKKFGKKAISFSENLILYLIFAVVGLLFIEFSFNISPMASFVLMWVDTAICLVFLLEFGTKIALVEGKWLYFRRHFLIDLLPSIPFGFFFWTLHVHTSLAHLSAGRAVRLVRISRLTRYIRILRPIIRVFRITTFVVSAIDRIIRKYENVFNRNIILFARQGEVAADTQKESTLAIQEMRERLRRRTRITLQRIPEAKRAEILQRNLVEVENTLLKHGQKVQIRHAQTKSNNSDVRFEELLQVMAHIDAVQIEEKMGSDFIDQSKKILRYISAPGVRHLPFLSRIAKASKEMDAAAVVAWLTRSLGQGLQKIQNTINWFGDLYGLITGPQVLDRVGLALINATLRPAKRLMLFGFLFLLVTLMIQAFSIGFLGQFSKVLAKFLGAPIIILGCLSMIPLLLGFWFRMIAGQKMDQFSRVSEAQFIGLLKEIKRTRTHADLQELTHRVLHPEEQLLGHSPLTTEHFVQELKNQLSGNVEQSIYKDVHDTKSIAQDSIQAEQIQEQALSLKKTLNDKPEGTFNQKWLKRNRVLLLYEDFLDGTPFHRSDTKTTNQLLGNITIQNIRRYRLELSFFENLRIERLDLSRSKLLQALGPYMWFTSITESLAHRIGRLIVEYNQHCIPKSELPWQTDKELTSYKDWKRKRRKQLTGRNSQAEVQEKQTEPFRTTEFTALHFISTDPEHQQAVRDIFGTEVAALLRAEKQMLIRDLFGFYPFHQMPREKRTFNLYYTYQKYAARGRIFFLPLMFIWWIVRGMFWGVRRIYRLVKDILRPPAHDDDAHAGYASFEVAIRQINRMRKPVYIESMRLRSLFDVEYLGLYLPGLKKSGLEDENYKNDLKFISATNIEWNYFQDLRDQRAKQVRRFDQFLKSKDWKGDGWQQYLESISYSLGQKKNEVLRAITAAYMIDHKKVRSMLEMTDLVLHVFSHEKRMKAPKINVGKKISSFLSKLVRTRLLFKEDLEWKNFELCWDKFSPQKNSDLEKKNAWSHYQLLRKEAKEAFKVLTSEEVQLEPYKLIDKVFDQVIRHNSIWSEEIVSLRTVQTLTKLDIQLYHDTIRQLGNFN